MKNIIKLVTLFTLSICAIADAKVMKQKPQTVTTQDIEETEEIETSTQAQRMRFLPGAQRRTERRMERRRGGQSECHGGNCNIRRQYTTSKSHIISHNGGTSVNISSPHISETKDKVLVTMNVGPVAAEDIMVEVDGDNIQITGEYNRSGTQISINDAASLPCAVDAERMTKKVTNGVLTITLPKM